MGASAIRKYGCTTHIITNTPKILALRKLSILKESASELSITS